MYKIAALWLALVLLSAFTLYKDDESVDLRIGTIKTVDTIYPYIAESRGFFEEENLSARVYSFGTSPALVEAIAAGEVDVAYMSVVPAAVWKERGTDIVIVAGASRGGDVVCTRAGERSGKIAVSGKGTMTETIFSGYVDGKTDYEPIYGIEPPDMPTALLVTRDVDAAITWEPFATTIEEAGGKCIMDVGDEWAREFGSKYQRNVLVVSRKIFNDDELMQKVMRVHEKTAAYLNSDGSDAEIMEAMGIGGFSRSHSEYNTTLDWDSMERLWEMARDSGYLRSIPERSEIGG